MSVVNFLMRLFISIAAANVSFSAAAAEGAAEGNRFALCKMPSSSVPCSIRMGSSGGMMIVGLPSLSLLLSLSSFFVVAAVALPLSTEVGRGVEVRRRIIRAK